MYAIILIYIIDYNRFFIHNMIVCLLLPALISIVDGFGAAVSDGQLIPIGFIPYRQGKYLNG